MAPSIPLTIIILAGGKSSRMGQDKGLMLLGDKTMIAHIISTAQKITDNIIIITANKKYSKYNYPTYSDIIPNKGPLGGIYTGLIKSKTNKNLYLSCDTPYLTAELLAYLIENSFETNITVGTTEGKFQPLFGIYDKSCVPIIETNLNENKLRISNLFDVLNTKLVPLDHFDSKNFRNLNSPSDL